MQKHALVTGGVQGIGRAIVEALLQRGDVVYVFDCKSDNDEMVHQLCAQGAHYINVDLASVVSIKNGFTKIPGKLDILVNNAGITRDMLALRMSEHDWDVVMNVNLKGAFFCTQQALLRMIKQQISYIISISSIVGSSGNPGQSNYAASKAGIMGMTKTLAREYAARNILVNAIAPGFITTAMTDRLSDELKHKALEHIPLKRFGMPQDIANLVLFLSSGSADYITGQIIDVSGGM